MAHKPWIPRLGHEFSCPAHGPDLFLCQKEKKWLMVGGTQSIINSYMDQAMN